MSQDLYPPSPVSLPENLTKLSFRYKLKASLAILAVISFFALYAALVYALGHLVYLAITYEIHDVNRFTGFVKIASIAGSAMLFVFTLKFIFKLKNFKPENRIELDLKKEPKLQAFINQICVEAKAPKPKRVYIDPDVNAYVAYSNTWLSLFMPVKKNLTIGLGLVNALNLTEFKAVIAHEFGHFAQRTMAVGSFIMSANTIIHDMIFTRDKWDELLDQWRGTDIRLSIIAWIITPVIWVIRQVLNLFYQFLNIMYSSLSREMEFNADRVAVSLTGSNAIISALWNLDSGFESWNETISHAYLASQKNMYVKNLYLHNEKSIQAQKPRIDNQLASLKDDGQGGKRYFTTSENAKVGMYASHPPNDLREDNAKELYVKCEEDQRSPALLFADLRTLQEQATALIYDKYLQKGRNLDVVGNAQFEDFVKLETQGKELLAEYHNSFENRYMNIPDDQELQNILQRSTQVTPMERKELKSKLKELMKPVKEIEALMAKAQQIAEGTLKEKSFQYNQVSYTRKNLHVGFNALSKDREELFQGDFVKWDETLVAHYLVLAKKHSKESNLLKCYTFHRELVAFYKLLVKEQNDILTRLNELQNQEEVQQAELLGFEGKINQAMEGLTNALDTLSINHFNPLPNVDSPKELRQAILPGEKFKPMRYNSISSGGLDSVLNVLQIAVQHCQRLDQNSIGKILGIHHELEEMDKNA